jgi:hypothetical protein
LLLLASGHLWAAKQVVGWVENVKVYPGEIMVKAKIDTGAKTSSIDCECITPIQKDGKDWVSFSVKNHNGDVVFLEKPVTRIARIKRHFGEEQVRYVVRLGICLGSVYREEEVTLVDRTGFNYSLLVGRNFLGSDFVVDPSLTFSNSPECKEAPE